MKKIRLVLITSCVLAALSAEAQNPGLAQEKLILRTSAGDILLAFYPQVAPQHVAQIVKMAKNGIYDGVHFYRVHRGFLAQLSAAHDRDTPLTSEQQAIIKKIPAEFSGIKHRFGVLSMARDEGEPNSAETSFSIMLGDGPHLDNQYTVFGRLEKGAGVLRHIERASVDDQMRPLARIRLIKAEVIKANTEATLAGPIPFPETAIFKNENEGLPSRFLVIALFVIMALSLGVFLAAPLMSKSSVASMLLIIFCVCVFALLTVLIKEGLKDQWVALVIFLVILMTFRLMAQFESKIE